MTRIFDVKVLSYNSEMDEYTVQYCIQKNPKVIRRSKAQYKNKVLLRDEHNGGLITLMVEDAVKYYFTGESDVLPTL